MKNKLFQFAWYYLVRPFVPVVSIKQQRNPVMRHGREIYVQVRLAKLFGEIDGFLAGDSNSAVFNTFAVMRRFSGVVLAIGQGGAIAMDWIEYFGTKEGRYVLDAMKARGVTVVWNIGGNYVLMGLLHLADSGMRTLYNTFPGSWYCTIPPIYGNVLACLSRLLGVPERDEEYYREGVAYMNNMIKAMASPKVIDIYKELEWKAGEPIPGALMDMVHFRRVTVDIIRQQIGGVI